MPRLIVFFIRVTTRDCLPRVNYALIKFDVRRENSESMFSFRSRRHDQRWSEDEPAAERRDVDAAGRRRTTRAGEFLYLWNFSTVEKFVAKCNIYRIS